MLEVLGREVRRIDLGGQPRLERRPEPPQIVKVDAREKWVLLDLLGTRAAEARLGVADETGRGVLGGIAGDVEGRREGEKERKKERKERMH